MKKIGILNANIVDGTKRKAYKGHVFVENQRIYRVMEVSKVTESAEADQEYKKLVKESDEIIDARDYTLLPGFIDTHSHSDLQILKEPILKPKIRQGITTEVLGQDGVSMAPLAEAYVEDWQKNISGLDGTSDKINWHYHTIDNYFKMIEEAPTTTNAAYLIPHGNVRLSVLGFEDVRPNQDQVKDMVEIVRQGMESGCVGLSSGLIYNPCTYGQEDELIAMCKVVKEYDGVFVVHQRSEANQILPSMDEIIRIGEASGVRIHFSHFKICGKNNWDKLEAVLEKLDKAKEKGVEVSFDMYPYTAGSTMLSAILPPWMHVGGTGKMLLRLQDSKTRKEAKDAMLETGSTWDNFVEFAGVEGIYVTSTKTEKNADAIGHSLAELGEMRGKDPLEATFDLLVEEENDVGMIDYYGSEDHLRQFVLRDEMNGCTDGLLGGKVHPRAYGAFARFIAEFVNRQGVIGLEDMVYKLTKKAADVVRIKERGEIKEGYYADLTLIKPDKVQDLGDYVTPDQYPTGINLVMVNGQVVYNGINESDLYDDSSCGKLLRMEATNV